MKKIYSLKTLFIALFGALTINANAQSLSAQTAVTHTINLSLGATQNVTVCTGDILEFHGVNVINFLVIFRNLVTPNNVFNAAPTPSLIVSYTVQVSDTSYMIKDINNTIITGRMTNTCLTTGIKETTNSATVKLFPNPVSNTLKVTTINKESLSILNITGQTLIESAVEAGTSDIDVSQLSPGIYFVRLGKERLKLIKE